MLSPVTPPNGLTRSCSFSAQPPFGHPLAGRKSEPLATATAFLVRAICLHHGHPDPAARSAPWQFDGDELHSAFRRPAGSVDITQQPLRSASKRGCVLRWCQACLTVADRSASGHVFPGGDMKRGWGLSAMVLAIAFVAAPARTEELLPPQVSAVPIPDGQVAAAVARLDAVVQEAQKRTGVPGVAVAVVHDGELVYVSGFGVREIGKPELVDSDTAFQLASVSKSVGATVVATQVSAGKVSWNSRVAELLPWFKLKDPAATAMLTVGDLYSHRSGLPEHAGDHLEDLGYDQRAILERLRYAPLKRFRDNYDYTNFGLTAAALAVAAAVGTDWNTLSDQAIYHPLGITRTSSRFSDYIAHDNCAVPHVKVRDVWEARYQRRPDAQTPAGGVSSTANDMAR